MNDSLHDETMLTAENNMPQPNQDFASPPDIKIYADGANLNAISELCKNPLIQGFTTNPTLMCKAGIKDYETFAHQALKIVSGAPISFEIFADAFDEIGLQARKISSWGSNVYVKLPITNTKAQAILPLAKELSDEGVKINLTAMMTLQHVEDAVSVLDPDTKSILSVFAGRIADTGRDPLPMMAKAAELTGTSPAFELLWASPREVLNVYQAASIGCDIITLTNDLIAKLDFQHKDLDAFSLETVQMFYDDAMAAGYEIDV